MDQQARRIKPKIFLLGVPHHNNLGDNAIAYAEEKFIKDNFRNLELIEFPQENLENIIDDLKNQITDKDIIFMHGGGNMGCEYKITEVQRRKVVLTFPNNKIIFFPQTIFFKDTPYEQNEFEESIRIYSTHKDLTIIGREEKSFEIMKNNFKKNRVILTPDIVTYLNESEPKCNRKGTLMIMRNDRERKIDDIQMNIIKNILIKYKYSITIDDSVRGDKIMIDSQREQRLNEIWDIYRKSEIVITDRLHGMIFAAITETPCIAMNNYNHKVSEFSKWFKNLNYIKFIDDINNFEKVLNQLRNEKVFDKYSNSFAIDCFKQILENT